MVLSSCWCLLNKYLFYAMISFERDPNNVECQVVGLRGENVLIAGEEMTLNHDERSCEDVKQTLAIESFLSFYKAFFRWLLLSQHHENVAFREIHWTRKWVVTSFQTIFLGISIICFIARSPGDKQSENWKCENSNKPFLPARSTTVVCQHLWHNRAL